MSIAVIAGLGNPGLKYRNSRHNLGFEVVDAFAQRHRAKWKLDARVESELADCVFDGRKLTLVKPQTFMNSSGRALGALLRYRKLDAAALVVIVDDITLEPARLKLSTRGSAGGHNGIADLIEHVGNGFARFRIGIGGKPERAMDLADYVLGQHDEDTRAKLTARMPHLLDQLERLVREGPQLAMNTLNQRIADSNEPNQDQLL